MAVFSKPYLIIDDRYKNYVKLCHSNNAGDLSYCNTIEVLDVPQKEPYWTSRGQAGSFMWRSLTTVFPPELHTLDLKKQKHNTFFSEMCLQQSGLRMMSYLAQSIDQDEDYHHLVENGNTLIANSDILFDGRWDFERNRAFGMKEFLRQKTTLNDSDCFRIEDGTINILDNNIKGRDIILPLPILMNCRFEMFVRLADELCRNGANTVYGVFITYCVPSDDGADYNKYPNIPEIRGLSFEELLGL